MGYWPDKDQAMSQAHCDPPGAVPTGIKVTAEALGDQALGTATVPMLHVG